jgi:hypothetical protein
MYMQISSVIIWPKNSSLEPRTVNFALGKVNVITGASRTGKSAIIPIIDYCLASSDCRIPIDVIRDSASWYGVLIKTEFEEILIARKAPDDEVLSGEYFVARATDGIQLPKAIEKASQSGEEVKAMLNLLAGVPSLPLHGTDENIPFQARLGFRDLMALVFQSQEIVANQNILFYKTHSFEHRERLKTWFPYILGVESPEVLFAKQELDKIVRRLRIIEREQRRAKEISSKWSSELAGQLRIAGEYGLLQEDILDGADLENLLSVADRILDANPSFPRTAIRNLEKATDDSIHYENEESRLSLEIGVLRKRLSDLKRLKSGLESYRGAVAKRVERLHLSEWIKEVASDEQKCGICGSKLHPTASSDVSALSAAFSKYEKEMHVASSVPDAFRREESKLLESLEELLRRKRDLDRQYARSLRTNTQALDEFQTNNQMHQYLGNLRAKIEVIKAQHGEDELAEEYEALQARLQELTEIVDKTKIRNKLQLATARIGQKMLEHLNRLDVEESYRSTPPTINIAELNLSVRSRSGSMHYLSEVGSASNWVSFHLALMSALQEYFIEDVNSPVPSFVVFDQPSQVYFPRLSSEDEIDAAQKYGDEDVEAVKGMFTVLASSILRTNGKWQAIVLDHAGSDIYGDVEGLEEVEVWRNGKKLIPEEWYAPPSGTGS